MATVILASRYNNLRQRANKVLGTSSDSTPDYGYGQPFSYNAVVGSRSNLSLASKITAQQYRELYLDLIKIRVHQVGASAVSVEPFVIGDFDNNAGSTDLVEEAYVNRLESLATSIETDRFEIDEVTQADIENLTTAGGTNIETIRRQSTSGVWNGQLTHIFDVEFDSALSRRHFFNSGGQVRLSARVDYAGSQTKTVQWQNAISAMGTISFTANSTYSNAGSGSGTNVGNYQITNSYRRVFDKQVSGTYSRNHYYLNALDLNTTTIRFRVQFFDGAPNDLTYGIDESVFGDFYSQAQLLIPNGSATINGVATDTVVYADTINGISQSGL